MPEEIERKFIVNPENETFKALIQENQPTIEERYYLFRKSGIELRFTSLRQHDDKVKYTFDRMEVVDDSLTVRQKLRWSITGQEFEELRSLLFEKDANTTPIIRHSYDVMTNPKVQIKEYQGTFAGLIRAEVEFDALEDCKGYQPLEWMGKEISDSPIGNDVTLADLTSNEVQSIVASFLS